MSNAEKCSVFQCDLKIFSVISVSLNNKGKYFSVIILDYYCGSFLDIFSVSQKFSVSFSV